MFKWDFIVNLSLSLKVKEFRKSVSIYDEVTCESGSLGSRVVSVLDSGAEGPGFKSQSRRCRVTVLGKLFTPIVHTNSQNW